MGTPWCTPTLLYVNIRITTTLAACLGLVARRDRADGLMYWALALVAHTGAYVLYALRGVASDWLSVVLANVLITSVFALMSEGVYKFQGRRPPRRWIWAPVPFVALTFARCRITWLRGLLLAAVLSVQFVQSPGHAPALGRDARARQAVRWPAWPVPAGPLVACRSCVGSARWRSDPSPTPMPCRP
jgi:hypothetical protein